MKKSFFPPIVQNSISEMKQDPMVLVPHVLCLPFVCGRTLAKD